MEDPIVPATKTTPLEIHESNSSEINNLETCLFVFQETGKRDVMKQLRNKYNACWDGAGYLIKDMNYKQEVEEFCARFNLVCIEQPAPENFDALPYYDPIILHEEQLEIKKRTIKHLLHETGIEYNDIDDLYDATIKKQIEYLTHGNKVLTLLFECHPLKEKIRWLEEKRSINNSEHPKKTITSNLNKSNEFKIQFINERPDDFLLTEAPQMPALVIMQNKGKESIFMPKGIVASVVGAGGIGKTHWLTQLALSITMEEPFLGNYQIKKAGCVALILGENSYDDIHRLLRKTIKGFFSEDLSPEDKQKIDKAKSRLAPMSVTSINASFIDRNGNTSKFYNQFLNCLIDIEPDEGFSCIILDPASRFMGPDAEKDNASATLFISLLEKITQSLKGKPTVLFGHHMNKNASFPGNTTTANASRGASALTDGVRWQMNLDRIEDNKNQIKMNVTKTNHTAYPDEQILTRNDYGHLKILENKKIHDLRAAQVAKDDIHTNEENKPNYADALKKNPSQGKLF